MGDSETLVAESSAVMSYNSAGYTNTGYADASTTAVPDASGCDPGMTGDYGASGASADAAYSLPGISDGNAYNVDPNAVMQHDQDPGVGAPGSGDHVAGSEYEVTGSSQAAGYNSMNGSVVSEAGNVPSTENVCTLGIGSEAAGQELLDGSAMSGEENRLWSIVKANSSDFGAWTALIEETEKLSQDNILKIRRVYDDFLSEFPLCYGYWKKYADHEARVGSMDKVVEVYERAVQGVTYSVDIWLHYCIFAINTYGDPETIRRLFERGLAYVGTDYLSFLLWDKYIEYEYMQQEWSRVAKIYTRILENPNQQLDRYFSSFKEFAASRPLSDLRTVEEVAAAAPSESGGEVKASEGEVQPDAAEQTSKHVSAGLTEAEELEQYIAVREEMYKKAKEFDSKIIDFESAIRRPYFHVKPLSVAELENWHNYLDFIEREGDFNKVCSCLPNHLSVKQGGSLISYMRGLPVTVVKLYERCLISCANYTEYWIRYVLCMEANGSMDLVENALARATQVFVKRLPEIHLFAARFKEQNGDIDGARSAYQLVHTEISPGLLEATIKHANMERRLGNLEDAFSLYEQAIAIEKGKEHSQTLPMLYAQYSRFLHLVSGNTEKARQVLLESLDHVQLSKPLLEALIHFESIQSPQKQIDYLEPLVDKFLMPNSDGPNTANAADREELSCIFLEFLGLFGDAQLMKKAEDRHARLFLPHRSSTELKKRHAEDFLASERAKMAKSYSGVPSPAQSLMGAYPSSQNPFAAGYGLQPPAWPPATPAPAPVPAQAQAQQWNSGYGQQAAYGAYSGYGSSYPAPQVSVPQNAAYGAYPPAYPAQQAFPQQGYSQPTAAATVTPAQQPASVPQAYYGSYY